MGRRRKEKIPLFDGESFAEAICEVVKESIISSGHSATGKAVDSIKAVKKGDDTIAITAVSYLRKIQTGTPPNTSRHVPLGKERWITSPEVALALSLKDGWLQARNLPEELAFPIAKSIITNGTLTYQKGGEDVWSTNVNDFVSEHATEYLNLDSIINFRDI